MKRKDLFDFGEDEEEELEEKEVSEDDEIQEDSGEEEDNEDDDNIIKKEARKTDEVDIEDIKEEEEDINRKFNYHDDNKKRNLIIILGIIFLIIIAIILYFTVIKGKNESKNKNNNNDKEVIETSKEEEEVKENIGYVSCDDNTSRLNVRNSTTGDIIDSLSCYKEVTIDEKVGETDNCKDWYKISYTKNGSNYTGYACGTYIKKKEVKEKTTKLVNELVEKVNNYYEKTTSFPWCGKTSDSKKVSFSDNGESFDGEYVKSEFSSIEEIKNYLSSFMDSSLIKEKIELSDYDNPKMYDNYYEIDGSIYCRNYTGKGFISNYTGNYDIEITSDTDSKITANIAYEYLTEETVNNDESKCKLNNLTACYNSNFEYKIGKVVIENKDGNYIVTKMDFHE